MKRAYRVETDGGFKIWIAATAQEAIEMDFSKFVVENIEDEDPDNPWVNRQYYEDTLFEAVYSLGQVANPELLTKGGGDA